MFPVKIIAVGALLTGLSIPALAGPEHIQTIREQCGIQLNVSASVCECIATAAADLNENQQAFAAAQVTSNGPEIARIQTLLSAEEALGVMNFMTGFGGCTG